MKVNQKVVLPASMTQIQSPHQSRQKHSDPFLLPWVRFKKLRSSLNLSSLYLEMRLSLRKIWGYHQIKFKEPLKPIDCVCNVRGQREERVRKVNR
jgi:hypothetical protein